MLNGERPGQQADLQAAFDQVGYSRWNAAIGHRGHVELVPVLQKLGRQMDR
jgi:hypothetical protein